MVLQINMEGEKYYMAKDSEKDQKNLTPISKALTRLNNISKDILGSITQNAYKMDNKNEAEIDKLNDNINKEIVRAHV